MCQAEPPDNSADDRVAFRPSRRTIIRGGLGAAGLGLLAAAGRARPGVAQTAATPAASGADATAAAGVAFVAVYPFPDSQTASPGTEISFRGVSAGELGPVSVVGSESGAHSGVLLPHSDGQGVSYLPDAPFLPGESVTVQAGQPLGAGADQEITFTVARPAPPPQIATARDPEETGSEPRSFRSRPDLLPPPITVTTPAAETAPGLIFVGVKSAADGQNGAMILDDEGELVWFWPMAGVVDSVNDFRVQEYRGEPVLTCWEGVADRGNGLGHFVIRDRAYQEIATLQAGNGYPGADLHEFLLTPQGTALIVVYNPVRWDLSAVGGAEDGTALDGIIQEIEVETGRVLFEWHSLDQVGPDEAIGETPTDPDEIFDYAHLNSVEVDADGNLVTSARNTCAVYKIDRRTGGILWRLGGRRSDFTMGDGTVPAYQHDARVHPNGELTLFDNAASTQDADIPSRGIVLELDTEAMTATLIHEHIHPTEILAVSQGNMQILPNGNAFVGWGSAPVFSEFSPDGDLLFNGRFPTSINTYRAYRCPWTGQPSDPPAIGVEAGDGDEVTVYASWNGATDVAEWQVLAGPDPDDLQPVASAPHAGFETAITAESTESHFAVQAHDPSGQPLATSKPIRLTRA